MESYLSPEAQVFAERILRQAASRFSSKNVHIDERRFALAVQAPDRTTALPLSRLYEICTRQPHTAAVEIAKFMQQAEKCLSPAPLHALPELHPLWMVVTLANTDVLPSQVVSRAIAPRLAAVIAEQHGDGLRPIVHKRWSDRAISPESAMERADTSTTQRFRERCVLWGQEILSLGELLITSTPPSLHAAFLAVKELRLLVTQHAESNVLVSLPDRDTMLLAKDDRKGRAWIRQQGRLLYEVSRYPGTGRVMRISSTTGCMSLL